MHVILNPIRDLVLWILTGKPLFGRPRKNLVVSRQSPRVVGGNILRNIKTFGLYAHLVWFWNVVVVTHSEIYAFTGNIWKSRYQKTGISNITDRAAVQNRWDQAAGYGDLIVQSKSGEHQAEIRVENIQRPQLVVGKARDLQDETDDCPIGEGYYFRLRWGTFFYMLANSYFFTVPYILFRTFEAIAVTGSIAYGMGYLVTGVGLVLLSHFLGINISN